MVSLMVLASLNFLQPPSSVDLELGIAFDADDDALPVFEIHDFEFGTLPAQPIASAVPNKGVWQVQEVRLESRS